MRAFAEPREGAIEGEGEGEGEGNGVVGDGDRGGGIGERGLGQFKHDVDVHGLEWVVHHLAHAHIARAVHRGLLPISHRPQRHVPRPIARHAAQHRQDGLAGARPLSIDRSIPTADRRCTHP